MLNLARKLSNCDAKYFGGWVIAGMEVKIKGQAERLENSVILAKARRCVHEARGYAANGELVQSLRLFLVLPNVTGTNEAVKAETLPTGEPVLLHRFSRQEIADYIAATGDENIIHKGQKPLVPGVYMLWRLQQYLSLDKLKWRVSFLAPVYTGEQMKIYEVADGFTAYVGQQKVFVVKI